MATLNKISDVDINRMVNNTPIFSGIGIHEQHLLASKWDIEDRKADETIIKQGDIGDRCYIILKGSVLISKKLTSKPPIKINILNKGDVFGEIAILRNIPRTADVITLTPCTFLSIDAKNFLEIYKSFSPKSRDNIQLVIEKRLQQHRIE